jgi:hypothetical protein
MPALREPFLQELDPRQDEEEGALMVALLPAPDARQDLFGKGNVAHRRPVVA